MTIHYTVYEFVFSVCCTLIILKLHKAIYVYNQFDDQVNLIIYYQVSTRT